MDPVARLQLKGQIELVVIRGRTDNRTVLSRAFVRGSIKWVCLLIFYFQGQSLQKTCQKQTLQEITSDPNEIFKYQHVGLLIDK